MLPEQLRYIQNISIFDTLQTYLFAQEILVSAAPLGRLLFIQLLRAPNLVSDFFPKA